MVFDSEVNRLAASALQNDNALVCEWGSPSRVSSSTCLSLISASETGRPRLCVGCISGKVLQFDFSSSAPSDENLVRESQSHIAAVTCVGFSNDGRMLATGANDCTARIWCPISGKLIRTLSGGHSSALSALAFSPRKPELSAGCSDGTLAIYNTDSGVLVTLIEGAHGGKINMLEFGTVPNQVSRVLFFFFLQKFNVHCFFSGSLLRIGWGNLLVGFDNILENFHPPQCSFVWCDWSGIFDGWHCRLQLRRRRQSVCVGSSNKEGACYLDSQEQPRWCHCNLWHNCCCW